MSRLAVFLCAGAVAALTGCGADPEVACLDSERIKFNDPSSVKVVQNLGKRWAADTGEHFWLRYSATNVVGGTVSSNMVCSRDESGGTKWARDRIREQKAQQALEAWVQKNYRSDDAFARNWAETAVYNEVKAFPQDLQPAPAVKPSSEPVRPR